MCLEAFSRHRLPNHFPSHLQGSCWRAQHCVVLLNLSRTYAGISWKTIWPDHVLILHVLDMPLIFFGSAVTTLTPSQPIMFFDIQYIYLSIYKVFLEPLPTHILTRLLKRSRWHDRALRWHRISSWRVGDSDPGEAAGISRGSRHVAELRAMFEIDKINKCVGLHLT